MTLLVKDQESIGIDQIFKINYFTHFQELEPEKYQQEPISLGLVDLEDKTQAIKTDDPSRIQYFFGGQ